MCLSCTGAEKVKEAETNPHKIEQRQKQVDFGKNTLGYENYRNQVAKCAPSPVCPPLPTPVHPQCLPLKNTE